MRQVENAEGAHSDNGARQANNGNHHDQVIVALWRRCQSWTRSISLPWLIERHLRVTGTGIQRVDRMQPERERCDDAKIAAAAAKRPEQIRIFVGIGFHKFAVG